MPFFCLKHLSPICVEVNSGHPGVCQPWLPFITNGVYRVLVWAFFCMLIGKVLDWFLFYRHIDL